MGWDLQCCMHGKREGLDRHDCELCQEMARAMGEDCSAVKSYLYRVEPAKLVALREKALLQSAALAGHGAARCSRV